MDELVAVTGYHRKYLVHLLKHPSGSRQRRKEDGRITHVLVAITGGSRWLLDREDWVEETAYRATVECFEELPLSRAILAQPSVVTIDDWRRYADGGPLSRSDLKQAASKLDMEQNSQQHPKGQ